VWDVCPFIIHNLEETMDVKKAVVNAFSALGSKQDKPQPATNLDGRALVAAKRPGMQRNCKYN
jgi:hypothetical protein